MPQSNTGNWRVKDIPYGKGSVHGQTLEASFRHWRRAMKINEAENHRCYLTTSILEKHYKAADNRKERVIQRLRQTLEELEAYKKVLQSYRVSNFGTLRWGYKRSSPVTPRSNRRNKLEMRIYDCGFSLETLKPEVKKVIEISKPEVKRSLAHERLLQIARNRSNFMIDRRLTNQAMLRENKITDVQLPRVAKERSVVQVSKQLLSSLQ